MFYRQSTDLKVEWLSQKKPQTPQPKALLALVPTSNSSTPPEFLRVFSSCCSRFPQVFCIQSIFKILAIQIQEKFHPHSSSNLYDVHYTAYLESDVLRQLMLKDVNTAFLSRRGEAFTNF